MNGQIKDLINEIDELVEKINQSDDEPSTEVLDSIEELTANDIMNTAVQSVSWGSGTFGDLMKKCLKLAQFVGLK